jgi:hypothetical protein
MLFRVALISALSAVAVAAPTGNALFKRNEGACPAQCQPLPYPGFPDGKGPNSCDITTSCVPFVVSNRTPKPLFCACRHGYKPASRFRGAAFRTTWSGQEGRVFVQPGVPCDTLCNNQLTCDEIPIRDFCWTNPRARTLPAGEAGAESADVAAAADDNDQAGDDQADDDQADDDQADDTGDNADDNADDTGDDAAGDDNAGDDNAGDDNAGDDNAGDDSGDGQ